MYVPDIASICTLKLLLSPQQVEATLALRNRPKLLLQHFVPEGPHCPLD